MSETLAGRDMIAASALFRRRSKLGMRLVLGTVAWALLLPTARASEPTAPAETMIYIVHPPESPIDVRYDYHWEILKTALETTIPQWGPYRIERSEFMTERRQAFELKNATGKLTVMYLSTTPELEESLLPIRIPVDRNLGGYNVLLIRKADQPRIDAAHTLDDLRQLTFGLGLGWIDVDILRANGFRVVTGSSYDGLFEMLANRRFDVFPRAAVEILDEYNLRKDALPDLAIEQNLLIYYPLPMYFWFTRTESGRRLAARAEEGMKAMIADGTYDRIFDKYQRHKIESLRLKNRRLLAIDNPLLGPETPFADKKLWFDPKTYR
jgi:ABC-type amino acid transport substrate-binding protein